MSEKPRAVYRDKLWIDPKIVSDKYRHADNHVEYYCYHEVGKSKRNSPYIPKDPEKEFGARKITYVCFSQFLDIAARSAREESKKEVPKPINRILYHMMIDPSACVTLGPEEQRRFLELSVKHRMLPEYVTPDTLTEDGESGTMVLLLEGLTPAQAYMYLSQYRYLREDPGFVKSILHLYDEIGMNFYAAFALASRVSIDYTVHHFLTLQRRYATKDSVNDVTVPFSTIAGLRRFTYRPKQYDDREVGKSSYSYEAASRIERICSIRTELKAQELLEPLVIKAFSALTDKTAKKYLDQYLRMKERIKYRVRKNERTKEQAAVGNT
jgi:hypothetical protein